MEWQEFMDKLEAMRKKEGAKLVIWTAHDEQVIAVFDKEKD